MKKKDSDRLNDIIDISEESFWQNKDISDDEMIRDIYEKVDKESRRLIFSSLFLFFNNVVLRLFVLLKRVLKVYKKKLSALKRGFGFSYTVGQEVSFKAGGNSLSYIISGFSNSEPWGCWTDGKKATMKFKIKGRKKEDLVLEMAYVTFEKQHILVFVNSILVAEYDASSEGKMIIIPKENLKRRVLVLQFEIPTATSPLKLGLSPDSRELGIGFEKICIKKRV